jgi:ketopantoate reductase
VLLGFPRAGGGWEGDELVMVAGDGPNSRGELCLGELDGEIRARTKQIAALFAEAGISVSVENDMDGWLKYHFAFMAPATGAILKHGGSCRAVAADPDTLHQYCAACREAGDVFRAVGYPRRQPRIFNLFYWLPRALEPWMFAKLFGSRRAEVQIGLHARTVGPELLDLASDFEALRAQSGLSTPNLDALLGFVRGKEAA